MERLLGIPGAFKGAVPITVEDLLADADWPSDIEIEMF